MADVAFEVGKIQDEPGTFLLGQNVKKYSKNNEDMSQRQEPALREVLTGQNWDNFRFKINIENNKLTSNK